MATIVLVHGIAQEQLAGAVLETKWLPALAGGVANSGNQRLADRIWHGESHGDIDTRMAYYGTPFLEPDAQGESNVDPDFEPLPRDTEQIIEQLALTWLHAAAESAQDPSDRRQAQKQLDVIEGEVGEAQGSKGTLGRPVLNALATIRWFAPFGMAIASRFVWKALTQVSRYLTDDQIRCYAQDEVLRWVDTDTQLVIGHSLGSVVAYEALHRAYESEHLSLDQNVTLITLGSPLGLQGVVYDKLRPQPPFVPTAVSRWENFAAKDDLVAARLDLKPFFCAAPGSTVTPETHLVDTGAKPHEIVHYLTKPSVGRVIAETLGTT